MNMKIADTETLSANEVSALKNEGWHRVTAGYDGDEFRLLEKAIAQLEKDDIPIRLIRKRETGPIFIYRQGAVILEGGAKDDETEEAA
ncbi:MAG: hypothetical protein V4481_01455 [Patescibacteria group bacterium]